MALFIVRMNLSKRRPPGKILRSTTPSPEEERIEKRKQDSKGKHDFFLQRSYTRTNMKRLIST